MGIGWLSALPAARVGTFASARRSFIVFGIFVGDRRALFWRLFSMQLMVFIRVPLRSRQCN